MPRCRTCSHAERDRIEKLLLAGVPEWTLANSFSISRSSIHRHRARHLPERLRRVAEIEEASAASDLLGEIRNLIERERHGEETALAIQNLALGPGGDRRVALRCIDVAGRSRDRQARALSLLGELRGALDRRPVVPAIAAPVGDPEIEAALAMATPEEQQRFIDLLHEVRSHTDSILARQRGNIGDESWTPPVTTTWSSGPNGEGSTMP